MTTNTDTFTGWAGIAKDEPLKQLQLKLKTWDEDSVEIDVTHCGICGSDEHRLCESWGKSPWPIVVGHEIVGKVTRLGKNAKNFKIGDRIGVGAQSGSCHQCENCLTGNENLCIGIRTGTYCSKWPSGDNSYGGYADKWRGDYRFVFKIPDELSSEIAATFFCAGVTTYAPLKRTNVNSESVVGVMGIGGLGHYGILWAKAMGAKVVGMSHNEKKHDVALELGCDEYLNTSNQDEMAKYKNKLTHILCTGTSPSFQWNTYFTLLKANGHFINVMAQDWDLPKMNPMALLMNQVFIHGSAIGSPKEIEEMLAFAVEKNVRPWITTYPMSEANKALEDFREGKPRFRFVLEN